MTSYFSPPLASGLPQSPALASELPQNSNSPSASDVKLKTPDSALGNPRKRYKPDELEQISGGLKKTSQVLSSLKDTRYIVCVTCLSNFVKRNSLAFDSYLTFDILTTSVDTLHKIVSVVTLK